MDPFQSAKQSLYLGLVLWSGSTGFSQIERSPADLIRQELQSVEELRRDADYEKGLLLAEELLQKAEDLGDSSLIAEALFQLSLMHYFQESFEEARVFMEIGLTHSRLHRLTTMEGDFLNAQGVLEWKQGNLHAATNKLEEALVIKKEAGQWVSMASISNNIGIIYYALKQFEDAVESYKEGLKYLEENDNRRLQASLHSNLGESLIPLGNFEEAEYHLQKSLEIELEEDDPLDLAYTYFNLGELRSGQGRFEEAIVLFETTLDIQLGIQNTWAAALTRLKMSQAYVGLNDPGKAIDVLMPGYEHVKELNSLPMLRDYAEQFSVLYEEQGLVGKAEYYSDLHTWFEERLGFNDAQSDESRSALAQAPSIPKAPDFSMIRLATLAMLGVLILFLLVENIRLRRELKSR